MGLGLLAGSLALEALGQVDVLIIDLRVSRAEGQAHHFMGRGSDVEP
jgi:hypothetical protein